MIIHCIDNAGKELLKSLISKKLVCFRSQKKDSWNKIFGNMLLVTDDSQTEIRNELTPIAYFGDTEDVSKFYVNKIDENKPFELMVADSIIDTPVNDNISDILIAQDTIVVKDQSGTIVYEITIDTAIILKMENYSYVISREWSLEEELLFVKTVDYEKAIYSIKKIIEEWSDEDEHLIASCNRKFISISSM